MVTSEQALDVARSQIGGFFPDESPYGEWYAARHGDQYRAAHFCAMGLSWSFAQANGLDAFPEHAYTPSGAEWFRAHGQWAEGTGGVQSGDIVYFDFPGGPPRISHVAIVESVNGDGSVNSIEFNTSGIVGGDQRNGRAVCRKRRRSFIVGYGRPTYGGTPSPAATHTEEDDMALIYRAGGYPDLGVLAHNGAFAVLSSDEELKNLSAAGIPIVWVEKLTLDELIADGRGKYTSVAVRS